MSVAYDDTNIFAKILRGEMPSHRVYDDGETIAVMDVMPQGTGHTLVLPKAPSRNLLDADPTALGAFGLAVAANVHRHFVQTSDQHARAVMLAMLIWPAITALPAFVVALAAAAMLRVTRRRV